MNTTISQIKVAFTALFHASYAFALFYAADFFLGGGQAFANTVLAGN